MMTTITQSLDNANWINSEWYKVWLELAHNTQLDMNVSGYWICKTNNQGDVWYEYIKN